MIIGWRRVPLTVLLSWLVTGCVSSGHPGTGGDFSDLIETAAPAVVTVLGPAGALGSGFVVGDFGLIATTAHGVNRQSGLAVMFTGGREVAVRVLYLSQASDMAVLAPAEPVNVRGLPLADAPPRTGSAVVVIGNPFGLGPAASAGIVGATPGALGRSGPLAGLIQTDAAVNPGNSGGPLLNMQGEVVGVVTASATPGHGIGFAVPVAHLRELLERPPLPGGQ